MTNHRRVVHATILVLLTLVPFLGGVQARSNGSGAQQTHTTGLDEPALRGLMRERLGGHQDAGIVVGILDATGNRRFVVEGRSGSSRRPALGEHSVFEIGSISKVFTAVVLADMTAKGEVRLDQPVADLLPPGTRIPRRVAGEITLGSLVTHTSGLPRMPTNFSPRDSLDPFADYTVEDMYRFFAGYELSRDVGERYEYSNIGAGLLGHALALRAGRDYEGLVLERVAAPLGLQETRVTPTRDMAWRLVVGHNAFGYPVPDWNVLAIPGAGALRSTAADMLTFLAANLASSGPLATVLASMHAPRAPVNNRDLEVGLGWHIRRTDAGKVIWHNGGTGGYRAFIGFNPQTRTAVVVLHNSATSVDDIGFRLLDRSFQGPSITPLRAPRTERHVSRARLDRLCGEYRASEGPEIGVARDGAHLRIRVGDRLDFLAFPASATEFFAKDRDVQLRFVSEAGRLVLLLREDGVDLRGIRPQPDDNTSKAAAR